MENTLDPAAMASNELTRSEFAALPREERQAILQQLRTDGGSVGGTVITVTPYFTKN